MLKSKLILEWFITNKAVTDLIFHLKLAYGGWYEHVL